MIWFLDHKMTYEEFKDGEVLIDRKLPMPSQAVHDLINQYEDEELFKFQKYRDAYEFMLDLNGGDTEIWSELPELILFGDDEDVIKFGEDWETLLDEIIRQSITHFEAYIFNKNELARRRMQNKYNAHLNYMNIPIIGG